MADAKRVARGIWQRGSHFYAYTSQKVNGRWRRVYLDAFTSKADAEHFLKQYKAKTSTRVRAGLAPTQQATTFGAHAQDWLTRKEDVFKTASYRSAASIVNRHLAPLAPILLSAMRPVDLERTLNAIATDSPKTKRNVGQVLRAILHDAFINDLCPTDLALHVSLPAISKAPIVAVPPEKLTSIFSHLTSPYFEAVVLAAVTGLRQGELLSLRWDDFDETAKTLSVRRARQQTGDAGTPKTEAGMRVIELSAGTCTFLTAYRTRQATAWNTRLAELDAQLAVLDTPQPRRSVVHEREITVLRTQSSTSTRARKLQRQRAGLMARRPDYLFPATQTRSRKRPNALPVIGDGELRARFHAACVAANVEMRFHDLRHAFASLVLAERGSAALHELAQHLGHTDPSFTLRQYTHFLPSAEAAVQSVDKHYSAVLGGAHSTQQ